METKEIIKREDMPILNPKVVVVKRIMSKRSFGASEDEEEVVVGSDKYERMSNTYTILKNHNEELVAKIKELAKTPFDGYVKCFQGRGKIESEMGDQFICMGDNGKRFFATREDVENSKKENILNLINKTYPVGTYFNENFGSIFGYYIISVHSNPFEHTWNKDKDYSYDGLMSACYQEKNLWFHEYCGEIEIGEHSNGYRTMFCHFNEEGNYVNRDYNFNIVSNSKEKTPTLDDALAQFSALIPEGSYVRKDNVWYGEAAAFSLHPIVDGHDSDDDEDDEDDNVKETSDSKPHGFRFFKYESKGKNTYASLRSRRGTKLKLPKTAVESSRKELMDAIESRLTEFGFSNSYNLGA